MTVLLVIVLALVVFPLMFTLIGWTIIRMSGWPKVAQRYGSPPSADADWTRVPSMSSQRHPLPPMHFNNVASYAFDGETVAFRQMRPFGWLAKPVRIPLAEIEGTVGRRIVRECFEFSTAAEPQVRIRVYGRARHEFEQRLVTQPPT